MTISTQTKELIQLYENKIKQDETQLIQINNIIEGYEINTETQIVKIYGVTKNLANFNIPISGLDNQIVGITSNIYNLYQDIVGIATLANFNGCPATIDENTGISTVYADVVSYKTYNFTFPNVFGTSTGTITTGNLGIGTHTFISQVAIGTYFSFDSGIGTCGIASAAIDSKLAQINALAIQRDSYISNVNSLKAARVKYQLEQLGYNQTIVQITGQIAESNSILTILKNSSLQEFF
jgi:hypothetical protein